MSGGPSASLPPTHHVLVPPMPSRRVLGSPPQCSAPMEMIVRVAVGDPSLSGELGDKTVSASHVLGSLQTGPLAAHRVGALVPAV